MAKYKSIREGQVNKIGYRLSAARANTMNTRQIYLNKLPVIPPVSMLGLNEEYKMNEQTPARMKLMDITKHPVTKSGDTVGDFIRYAKRDVLYGKQPTAKTYIKPLTAGESMGPKW